MREGGYKKTKIISSLDRKKVLKGGDIVITTILVGGVKHFAPEVEIPMKYGVDINIGDSMGVGAVFRFLRTYPMMRAIGRDIERLAPKAFWLNYTNPMSMLSSAILKSVRVPYVGLCHSVQRTGEHMAGMLGVDPKDVDFLCAGINHQSWLIEFNVKGVGRLADVRKAVDKKSIRKDNLVRNEMCRRLGYYVTESSGHNSEYNWWFRKRPDLIKKYCLKGKNWNPGEHGYILKEYREAAKIWKKNLRDWVLSKEPLDLEPSPEYASSVAVALLGGDSCRFNGNVLNHGSITNLPYDCCVEIPVLATRRRFTPIRVGALPPQCAALNMANVQMMEMAVEAALTGNRELVYQACYFAPLAAAVLSLEEITKMVDELFQTQARRLPPELRQRK